MFQMYKVLGVIDFWDNFPSLQVYDLDENREMYVDILNQIGEPWSLSLLLGSVLPDLRPRCSRCSSGRSWLSQSCLIFWPPAHTQLAKLSSSNHQRAPMESSARSCLGHASFSYSLRIPALGQAAGLWKKERAGGTKGNGSQLSPCCPFLWHCLFFPDHSLVLPDMLHFLHDFLWMGISGSDFQVWSPIVDSATIEKEDLKSKMS